ncbi:SDR family NAD(P)-dependent oxidoreductase [Micromonospora sp. NBC_01813]|uniref:SDR family NAD(P)-dependent oxidoreductase n=1 Tax=Micromonospora sp. NBC_01813 TaxID=2975988 RepID=UPI002DDA6B54|nr:SDR family oxidoreductase [Micromonospora sp. NBC_01813]WSA10083.1 SDR family oxidoreductase [Micromonospora sp. NBC_01813]
MRTDESVFRLDGRVAAVTGAGSGIGRAVAQTLAGVGASVVVADIDADRGAETVAAITDAGGQASFQRTDVSRRPDLDALVSAAVDRYGGLDIQCNIAGVPSLVRDLTEVTGADLDAEFAISVKGVLYGCQAAAEVMARRGAGTIVNISSTAADLPAAGYGLYHLGKLAVVGMTRTLALELGPKGIRVNAIAPGATLTNFSARNFTNPDGSVDEERKRQWLAGMAARSPMNVVGDPQDQALLVLYLVSDAARFVTGQLIRANGGWSMG